jgi:fumarylpyruvate hydrolase
MQDFVFTPEAVTSLAVQGMASRFPVRRVYCMGRNYPWPTSGEARVHLDQRDPLVFFMKPAGAVVLAEGVIPFPPLTTEFCHEIELVVAIGKAGVNISDEDALTHVWGYAAGLDLTRRDIQMQAKALGHPWEGAKAFDACAASSPIVPVATSGHPENGAIWLKVNGVERQRGDLRDQIWSVCEVISFLSKSVQLKAGDLIFTGTPTGVASLQPGDVLSGGIDGVGQFSVTIGPC